MEITPASALAFADGPRTNSRTNDRPSARFPKEADGRTPGIGAGAVVSARRVRVALTAEQAESIHELWTASRNYSGTSHTVVGELRRETYPAGGALFIEFTAVPAPIADAMRLAYSRAIKNGQAKEVTPKNDLTDAN